MLGAILVAAGSSRRMGFDKLFAEIAGKPVIAHSIAAFETAKSVAEIIIVAREDRHREISKIVSDENLKKIRAIVSGGEHRHDSVRAGLQRIAGDAKHVAVHDAARPLITPEQIESVYARACKTGAAALAEPVRDTIKRADVEFLVTESVDRHQLYAMQTPQIFWKNLLEEAYRIVAEKNVRVTDEVSAVQLLGHEITLIVNEDFNFKVTYPHDIAVAELVLRQREENS